MRALVTDVSAETTIETRGSEGPPHVVEWRMTARGNDDMVVSWNASIPVHTGTVVKVSIEVES